MNKTKYYIIKSTILVSFLIAGIATWKIIRHWHGDPAKNTGSSNDESISSASEKLEKAAIVLENEVKDNPNEDLENNSETILADTRKVLQKTLYLVLRTLDRRHINSDKHNSGGKDQQINPESDKQNKSVDSNPVLNV